MRHANIVPPQWEGYFPNSAYKMALAHWVLAYPKYARALSTSSSHILLDNGVFEGQQVTTEDLDRACSLIGPDEVALMDVRGQPRETLEASWTCLHQINAPLGVLFIPQGRVEHEWQACLDAWMAKWKQSDWGDRLSLAIGITNLRGQGVTAQVGTRRELVAYALGRYEVPVHLLGVADPATFTRALPYYTEVRGIDTSLAFALGYANKLLVPDVAKVSLQVPDQYITLDYGARTLAYLNMLILEYWTTYHYAPEYTPLRLCQQAAIWGGAEARAVIRQPQVALRKCYLPEGTYAICDEGIRACALNDLRPYEYLIGVYQ